MNRNDPALLAFAGDAQYRAFPLLFYIFLGQASQFIPPQPGTY